MKLTFGQNQYLMSRRLSKYPTVGKWFNRLFGSTNIGQYARADIFKKIVKKLPSESYMDILDLGCGQGEYAFMMAGAAKNSKITALDIEPTRIDAINRIINKHNIPNLVTHLGNCKSLPENARFDFIYSIDVFEHIEIHKMPFKDAFARLKSNGRLLVKMPSKNQITVLPQKWFKSHQKWLKEEHIGQVYMLNDLKRRMQEEGFQIEHSFYSDGRISRLSWELGYLSRKAGVIPHLILLPILKSMIILDRILFRNQPGNSIQIIGIKP